MNAISESEPCTGPPGLRHTTALISTAGHCEIACGFCLRADRARGFLDIPIYARSLSRLKEIGVESVCLTGGEPSHHPQLGQLVRLAHQFGLLVSVVTSARAPADVARLSEIGHLLANVTVSADTTGAMALGDTTRSVESGITTLHQVDAPARILHLTYWDVTAAEAERIHRLVEDAGTEMQLSPVSLTTKARQRVGLSLDQYLDQQRRDSEHLARRFRFTPRFDEYLRTLRSMHLRPGLRSCRSGALYLSARGELRRCPYSTAGISISAPRSEISRFLRSSPPDRTTPDCAAICRRDDNPVSG